MRTFVKLRQMLVSHAKLALQEGHAARGVQSDLTLLPEKGALGIGAFHRIPGLCKSKTFCFDNREHSTPCFGVYCVSTKRIVTKMRG